MKARFAILSAISFWLYAISVLVVNVMETVVHAKLIERVGNFSSADYAIDIASGQKVLLIVGCVALFLFAADTAVSLIEKRKNGNTRNIERKN